MIIDKFIVVLYDKVINIKGKTMAKISRGQAISNEIMNFKMSFINSSEEERLHLIEKFAFLNNYQRVAIMQCKKFMSSKEKKAYKTKTEEKTQENSKEPGLN